MYAYIFYPCFSFIKKVYTSFTCITDSVHFIYRHYPISLSLSMYVHTFVLSPFLFHEKCMLMHRFLISISILLENVYCISDNVPFIHSHYPISFSYWKVYHHWHVHIIRRHFSVSVLWKRVYIYHWQCTLYPYKTVCCKIIPFPLHWKVDLSLTIHVYVIHYHVIHYP